MAAVDASAGLEHLATYYWKVTAVDGFGERRESTCPGAAVCSFVTDNGNVFPGVLRGRVREAGGGLALGGAEVVARLGATQTSLPVLSQADGRYVMVAPVDALTVTARKGQYREAVVSGVDVVAGAVSEPVNLALIDATRDADVSIVVVDGPDPVEVGGVVTYTATVHNAGPQTASDVTLRATRDAATPYASVTPGARCTLAGRTRPCPLGELASGGSAVRVVTVRADAVGDVSATFSASTASPDPDDGDTVASVKTRVLGEGRIVDSAARARRVLGVMQMLLED